MNPLLDLSARPVIGHRGNRAHAPENTLESFRQAVALGVDGLELDVRLSRDGHVVVLHDPTLDRTTDARGAVAARTLSELRGVDAGARFPGPNLTFPYRGRGIGIPLLSDVLAQLPNTPLLIEIKVPEAGPAVRQVIEKHRATDRSIVAAFDVRTLRAFAGSSIPMSSGTSHVARLLLPALIGRRQEHLPFQVMSLPPVYKGIPLPLGAIAHAVAAAGVPVHVWTINSAATAQRLWRKGVRGILSDDPEIILRAREAFTRDEDSGNRGATDPTSRPS
jgi:glycerophosphoryl diester phosphodiesterase